jgi:methyl-accepting chemotaxis protein
MENNMKLKNYILKSIRNRGVAVVTIPLLLIVAFILLYYPSKQKDNSLENLETQVKTLSEMLAFSVGAGLNDGNFELVQTAFDWSKKDKNVAYVSILDENDEVLIEYNPKKHNVNPKYISSLEYDESKNALVNSVPINYKNNDFGKIVLLYSLESVNETIAEGTYTTILIAGIIMLFGIVWVIFVFNRISSRIVSLRDSAVKASEGDLSVDINKSSIDEIGDLADAFKKMLVNIKEANIELEEQKKSVEKKVEDAVKESEAQRQYLSENVSLLLNKMELFAQGDLTVRLNADRNDTIGQLFEGFNKTVQNIGETLQRVFNAVESTAEASSQISASSEEMAAGSQEQSTQANEVAAGIEEMTKTILQTAANAVTANDSAKSAESLVSSGTQKIEENKRGIERIIASAETTGNIVTSLANRTDQIGEIIQVIDDIADQTNLLALNAAIEAARAGEQGRGFAVVADEVRKLAERTTKATKEIAQTIQIIQKEAKEADSSMSEAGKSVTEGKKLTYELEDVLKQILTSTNDVSIQIEQVATASEEQSSTAEQISRSIESINSVTQESAQGIQQIALTAEDLYKMTEELKNIVSSFKLNNYDDLGNYNVRANGKILKAN